MKKIFLFVLGALVFMASDAQIKKIDRSKKPKAGPAPVINIKDPVIFKLSNGLTVLVVENHKLPKVSASLTIDAGPVKEDSKAGTLDLMGQMLEEGSSTMSKADYDEAIDMMGANVGLSWSGGSASSLTRYFPRTFELFSVALKNPSFPQAALDKLKQQTITGLKSSEKSASTIASRVNRALSYGKNTAQGEFTTEESVKSITLDDIKAAYKNFITPSRSYLTFVGDITPAAAKQLAEKNLGTWTGTKLKLPTIPDENNPAKSEINFVDLPTAVQAEINVGNLVNNPMNGKEYFPLLLANYILGGSANSKLFMNLREKHGFTYGSYSSLGSGRFQSLFNAGAAVRTDKADSAVAEIVREILHMRDGKITAEELSTAKAAYNGSFALGMEDPARSARYASNILINNLPKDFYRTYLQKINAVTVDDIKRVAKNYMSESNSRIVIVGNGSKVIPNLMRLGYPIKKYDKYANPVVEEVKDVKADASVKTTDKVSAFDIVEGYLKAIGGKEELKKINSMSSDISMEMMGRSFEGTDKRMNPNKQAFELKMGAMTVVKKIFNGATGYTAQMGQKKDYDEGEIKEAMDEKSVIAQLFYVSPDYKLEYLGAGTYNNESTYRLKVAMPSGRVAVQQYSSKTGLLLQEEITDKDGDISLVTYGDYRKVGAYSFPFEINASQGGQEFPIKITSIKINEGVSEEDFK